MPLSGLVPSIAYWVFCRDEADWWDLQEGLERPLETQYFPNVSDLPLRTRSQTNMSTFALVPI